MKHVQTCLSESGKAVITDVVTLCCCSKPVYVRVGPENAVLTSEVVL